MSNLKISSNQFIGSKELNQFQKFLSDDGYKKLLLENSIEFGLTYNAPDGTDWTNGQIEQGTNTGTIKHATLFAVDNQANFLVKSAQDNITITDDSLWYWVKVAHSFRNYEDYIVDVDASGNLSCPNSDGNFTDILRGQPNIPVRVKFPDASLNTGEYDVQSVTDDNNAILQGSFQAESGVQLTVVGTFTPDANPSAGDKDIYNYDHATITLVQSTNEPAHTSGQEFFLARVQRTGSVIVIEDKRSNYIYRDKGDYASQSITDTSNPLIGLEAVKYDDDFSTRQYNLVEIGWGFRSSNFTTDPSTKLVTINAGLGGKYKSTNDFTTGEFNGWRLYANGQYHKISNSVKSGSQINLTIDSYDEADLDAATEIYVAPDADTITIRARNDAANSNELVQTRRTFPIAKSFGIVNLLVYADPTATYYFDYYYSQGNQNTEWVTFPVDNASGFLTEDSFDDQGVQTSTVRQTYDFTSNLPEFQLNPSAFRNVIGRVDLGDAPGVEYQNLDNGNPVKTVTVGTQKQLQVYQGSLTLSVDHFISLETTGAVEGNIFYFKFENDTTLSGNGLKLVEDYVNPGSPGTTLIDFAAPTAFWRDRAAENNMFVFCEFDGTNWVVYPDSSVTQAVLDIITGGSVLITGSTSTGVQKYDADPTGKAGWDNRSMPDRQYVDDQIAGVIDGAPATLNTLNELAAAIADDPNYSATVNTALAGKLDTGANAVSASQWQTARTVTFATGDVTGNFTIDGSANVSNVVLTVVDDSHNHIIANVDGLQTALDGKFDSTSANVQSGGSMRFNDNISLLMGTGSDFDIEYDDTAGELWINGNGTTTAQVIRFREAGTNRFSFDVDGVATGEATAIDWVATSDRRLKDNIRYGIDWTEVVKHISGLPVKYNLKEHLEKGVVRDKIGFIAQDIEAVVPEFVKQPREEGGMKGVYYEKMVAPLYQVLGAALERIEELEQKIK